MLTTSRNMARLPMSWRNSMQQAPLKKIVICGAGLAGVMCAAALSRALPAGIDILLIDTEGADKTDIFFGTVTPPSSYKFLLDIGIGEPDLLPLSNTSFSLGTQYKNWGGEARSWTQSYHQPLPVFNGVEFQHYLTRLQSTFPHLAKLESYIMSTHAAQRRVFAHPPEDRKIPLSTVEYGYHFLPSEWRKILSDHITSAPVKLIKADIKSVQHDRHNIRGLKLSGDIVVEADFFIDCTGPDYFIPLSRQLHRSEARKLVAAASFSPQESLSGVSRTLTGTEYGWTARTPFQNGDHTLKICDPSSDQSKISPAELASAAIGFCDQPWRNNYLTLGHRAACLEPLTAAPIHLLQRDITRLIELIPVTPNMTVERREYNRRFKEDYEHADAFHRGFFETAEPLGTAYWDAARAEPVSSKLENKITQFQSRGTLVQYDLEPFGKEDWTQLHMGMGRFPQRYDKIADKVPERSLVQTLQNRIRANEEMALRLPSHYQYMMKLLAYFRKQA